MEELAAKLPLEVVDYILSFVGKFKFRNGKYMRLILNSDQRYTLLSKIPQPIDYWPGDENNFTRIVVFKGKTHSLSKSYDSKRGISQKMRELCKYIEYKFKSVVQCDDVNEKYIYKCF